MGNGREQNSYFVCTVEFPACVYHATDRHSFTYDFFQLGNSGEKKWQDVLKLLANVSNKMQIPLPKNTVNTLGD